MVLVEGIVGAEGVVVHVARVLLWLLLHKKLNTYTKNQLCISINFGEKPYRKKTIKMAIARLIFRTLILIFGTHSPVVAHYQLVFAESF